MIIFIVVSTVLTLTYSVRLTYYVYFKNYVRRPASSVAEEIGILAPIRLLIVLSLIAGAWLRLNIFPCFFIFLPADTKILIIISLGVVGALAAARLANESLIITGFTGRLLEFFRSMWFIPLLSSIGLMSLIKIGAILIKTFDSG